MEAREGDKDSAKKRKLLKRRREPSSTDQTNSEEFAVPSASDVKKKPLMPLLMYMVGQTKIRPSVGRSLGNTN